MFSSLSSSLSTSLSSSLLSSLPSRLLFQLLFHLHFYLFLFSVCGGGCCCVVLRWKKPVCPSKTSPCVHWKRRRVCWHHAHTCFNMCVWDVLDGHTTQPQHHDKATQPRPPSTPQLTNICPRRVITRFRGQPSKLWILHIFSLKIDREHIAGSSNRSLYLKEISWAECNEQLKRQYCCGNHTVMVTLAVYPRFFSTTLTFRADVAGVATIMRVTVSLVVHPCLFPISHHFAIQSTAREARHARVRPHPLLPPGNPNTIQYFSGGRPTSNYWKKWIIGKVPHGPLDKLSN